MWHWPVSLSALSYNSCCPRGSGRGFLCTLISCGSVTVCPGILPLFSAFMTKALTSAKTSIYLPLTRRSSTQYPVFQVPTPHMILCPPPPGTYLDPVHDADKPSTSALRFRGIPQELHWPLSIQCLKDGCLPMAVLNENVLFNQIYLSIHYRSKWCLWGSILCVEYVKYIVKLTISKWIVNICHSDLCFSILAHA